jgi:hypothetical protein
MEGGSAASKAKKEKERTVLEKKFKANQHKVINGGSIRLWQPEFWGLQCHEWNKKRARNADSVG